jgi:hypothetical protein
VHQLNPDKRHSGWPEGFESEHRSRLSLDGSMILLDNVVEIFDLAQLQ